MASNHLVKVRIVDNDGDVLAIASDGSITATVPAGDLEIGAVEIKNAGSDDRAVVDDNAAITEAGMALAVHDAVLGVTTDAAVSTSVAGTVSAKLRGIIVNLIAIAAQLPASLGIKASAASLSVAFASDAVLPNPAAPTTIYNGNKTVTSAGTRVTLASSQAVKSVVIKALIANTGVIYVGDGSVASTTGFVLAAGDTVTLDIANLATVNLDSSVSGEGVTYVGTN